MPLPLGRVFALRTAPTLPPADASGTGTCPSSGSGSRSSRADLQLLVERISERCELWLEAQGVNRSSEAPLEYLI